jgi:hypothetical protein
MRIDDVYALHRFSFLTGARYQALWRASRTARSRRGSPA